MEKRAILAALLMAALLMAYPSRPDRHARAPAA